MTTEALPIFEGQPTTGARVKITNAGDGLSDDIVPEAHELGDELAFILRGHVTQIAHLQKESHGPLVRVHTVKATDAVRIDLEMAEKSIRANADELERLKA